MNEIEQTKLIIEDKYYTDIFDAIADYLKENPDEFCYEGDYYIQVWNELGLCDYKINEVFNETNHGIRMMNVIVEASISVFGLEGTGLVRIITEMLYIVANVNPDIENFKVICVGKHVDIFWSV